MSRNKHSKEERILVESRQHPYGFVPFPETCEKFGDAEFLHHHRFSENTISGKAVFEIEVKSPVHIGSGIYELSENVGFNQKGQVVRGIMRKDDEPIIPGSSIKGALRSVYEAITKSCVSIVNTKGTREKYNKHQFRKSKLPQRLTKKLNNSRGQIYVTLNSSEITTCREVKSNEGEVPKIELCPACALFGGMGYLGRIKIQDAEIKVEKRKANPLGVEFLNSPHPHRVGAKGDLSKNKKTITIKNLYGRKFYYQADIENGNDLIDYIPVGTILKFTLIFDNILEEELGGILTAFAINENFPFHMGGGKTNGLGHVKIHPIEVCKEIQEERFRSFNPCYKEVTIDESWIESQKKIFKQWEKYFYPEGLKEVKKITNKRRPTKEEVRRR